MHQTSAAITILIADRNPRVRDFLRRELSKEGYRVELAESPAELLGGAAHSDPPDLLIVDPDFPGSDAPALVQGLKRRFPQTVVVVHTHDVLAGSLAAVVAAGGSRVIEKRGSSVEALKQLASELAAYRFPGGRPAV
jgi:CheY-like chemotaxis protein